MTTREVERRLSSRNKLENRKDEVIGAFVEGITWSQMCERFGCSDAGLGKFHEKYRAEIEDMRGKAAKAIEDYAIAHKVNRVAEYDGMLAAINDWLREHGLTERAVRYDKNGNEVGETIRFRRDVMETKRNVLRSVAEETGQLPRPSVEVNDNRTFIFQVVTNDNRTIELG